MIRTKEEALKAFQNKLSLFTVPKNYYEQINQVVSLSTMINDLYNDGYYAGFEDATIINIEQPK